MTNAVAVLVKDRLKDVLLPQGFRRLGNSAVYAGRWNEVAHAVWVRASTHGDSVQIVLSSIGPSRGSSTPARLVDRIKEAPASTDLSTFGLGHEKWWYREDVEDEGAVRDAIQEIALPYLASVNTPHDVHECVASMGRTAGEPYDGASDSNGADSEWTQLPTLSLEGIEACPRLSPSEFNARIKAALDERLRIHGFQLHENERQLAFIRHRDPFIDVLEPQVGTFGASFYLAYYVMSPAIWTVRPELEGLMVQTNGGEISRFGGGGALRSFSTRQIVEQARITELVSRIESEAMPFQASMREASEFLEQMSYGWDTALKAPLKRMSAS